LDIPLGINGPRSRPLNYCMPHILCL
jgi:hypothetical protein